MRIIAASLLLFFTGCAAHVSPPVIETVEVKVPVMEKPALKPVYMPGLPTAEITADSTPGEIVSAYYNTVKIMERHILLLEIQLKPFWDEYKNR
jgi:hypothetical protein